MTVFGFYKSRRFRRTYGLHYQSGKNKLARNITNNYQLNYVPPKRRFLQEPQGVTSQKMAFFIVSAVETSNFTLNPLSSVAEK
jgi:hypothetical protein